MPEGVERAGSVESGVVSRGFGEHRGGSWSPAAQALIVYASTDLRALRVRSASAAIVKVVPIRKSSQLSEPVRASWTLSTPASLEPAADPSSSPPVAEAEESLTPWPSPELLSSPPPESSPSPSATPELA